MGYFKIILPVFEAMSGLRVNLSRSVIIPIGEVPNVNVLAHFFGCRVDYLPSFYLGLPLGVFIRVNRFGTLLLRGFIFLYG